MTPQQNFCPKTVILANGAFPQRSLLQELLLQAQRVICCDGAANALWEFGRKPDFIIGDLDSLSQQKEQFLPLNTTIIQEEEQETNDLCKAFRYCISQNWQEQLIILGATGKREDHTLGNLAHFADFTESAPSLQLWTDEGYFQCLHQSGTIPAVPGQAVSLFSLDGAIPIVSQGLQWPLQNAQLSHLWSATLNRATATEISLQFSDNHPILIFQTW